MNISHQSFMKSETKNKNSSTHDNSSNGASHATAITYMTVSYNFQSMSERGEKKIKTSTTNSSSG